MNPREIVARISLLRGVPVHHVIGPRRYPHLVAVRREIATLMRELGYSYPRIGEALGGRHHTTAMNLCGVFADIGKHE